MSFSTDSAPSPSSSFASPSKAGSGSATQLTPLAAPMKSLENTTDSLRQSKEDEQNRILEEQARLEKRALSMLKNLKWEESSLIGFHHRFDELLLWISRRIVRSCIFIGGDACVRFDDVRPPRPWQSVMKSFDPGLGQLEMNVILNEINAHALYQGLELLDSVRVYALRGMDDLKHYMKECHAYPASDIIATWGSEKVLRHLDVDTRMRKCLWAMEEMFGYATGILEELDKENRWATLMDKVKPNKGGDNTHYIHSYERSGTSSHVENCFAAMKLFFDSSLWRSQDLSIVTQHFETTNNAVLKQSLVGMVEWRRNVVSFIRDLRSQLPGMQERLRKASNLTRDVDEDKKVSDENKDGFNDIDILDECDESEKPNNSRDKATYEENTDLEDEYNSEERKDLDNDNMSGGGKDLERSVSSEESVKSEGGSSDEGDSVANRNEEEEERRTKTQAYADSRAQRERMYRVYGRR